ncbi:MAG: bifunctional oligoribonuclease/PAP phosphatase NrnA [Bacilli bacterium]|nr:bifunctional oligoribonuclease/PAP phosphatase NrnA [Bacilli bacterium]
MGIYQKIYREIKKAKKIVIARHIGPDPDAVGSTQGLRDLILNTFPDKQVYVVGTPASKFKYLGVTDKFTEDMYDALLIVTDTPDAKRVDGIDVSKFSKSIKIDHHPFMEKMCNIEWIDDSASSACELIIELAYYTNLKISYEAAEKLYIGLVSDTNRFLFKYSTPKTFDLVSYLIKETNLDITKAYEKLYIRPFKEIKFHGYMQQNMQITENKVGYIIIEDETLKKFKVDPATPGNMINEFNYIEEIIVWASFTYDKEQEIYRVSIRSRGPIINGIASQFNGGGHIYASGARIKKDKIKELIDALDKEAKEYIDKQ